MVTANSTRRDKLLNIGFIAKTIKSLCGVDSLDYQPITSHCTTSITFPTLSLSCPDAIFSLLVRQGCSRTAAQALSDSFLYSARQLKAKFESNYSETCIKLAPYLKSDPAAQAAQYKDIAVFMELRFNDQIATIKDLTLERFKAQQNRSAQKNTTKVKPTFNQEYVPLLEKYFEYNAYPSAPDRLVLARKSMMTPRQIEVWFQNHRNRSKKEGKALRRLTSDTLPQDLSLESLKALKYLIPKGQTDDSHTTSGHSQNTPEKENNISNLSQIPPAFSNTAPPHAFPTPYSPTSPQTNRYIFPTPIWMRNCSTIRPTYKISTIDDLITDFTLKLVFSETKLRQRTECFQPDTPHRTPWFAATHTTPPSAPHPAFIPPSLSQISTSLPINSMSLPQLHTFGHVGPIPHVSTTPIPNTRRKVASLPKRIPKHRSALHHGQNCTTPESSPSSLFSPSSRSSSFDSNSSNLRRPSSSSSTSSNTSSCLNTPIFSPASLPEGAQSPFSISGIDFQILDDLSDDYPSTMQPLNGIDSHSLSHQNLMVSTLPLKNIFHYAPEAPISFLS